MKRASGSRPEKSCRRRFSSSLKMGRCSVKAGSYCIRITEDINRNNMVDTGVLLEHKQPEKVRFFKVDDQFLIEVLERAEMVWKIDMKEMFK